MSADAAIVFFPRFTTLIGVGDFSTAPIDVSGFSGVQFQVWRASVPSGYDATFSVYLEESLDAQTWVLGTASPTPVALLEGESRFFSYSFRLRWFRLRIRLSVPAGKAVLGMWAEGLLRGGGSGVWGEPPPPAQGGVMAGTMDEAARTASAFSGLPLSPRAPADPWSAVQAAIPAADVFGGTGMTDPGGPPPTKSPPPGGVSKPVLVPGGAAVVPPPAGGP